MNPYEYETTLDCRDNNGVLRGIVQQPQHYDYEYQHLQQRASDRDTRTTPLGSTTHGRGGCLLEGVTPSAPPDVPPRNPTMNRMNNGRLAGNPNDLGVDFEPSCLVRTPSGNVYIPSGNLNINKGSPIDYKSGSACSTPTKETLKSYERSGNSCMGPVLPPRSVMGGIPSHHHHYSAPMNFRKDLAARCSAKCIAIVSISIVVSLCVLLILLTGFGVLTWSRSSPCTVLVGNEASEVTAAKSTNTDLSKLHNTARASKSGQPITVTAATSSASPSSFQSTSASAVAPSSSASSTSSSSSASSSSLANSNTGARKNVHSKHSNRLQREHEHEHYREQGNARHLKRYKRYRRSVDYNIDDFYSLITKEKKEHDQSTTRTTNTTITTITATTNISTSNYYGRQRHNGNIVNVNRPPLHHHHQEQQQQQHNNYESHQTSNTTTTGTTTNNSTKGKNVLNLNSKFSVSSADSTPAFARSRQSNESKEMLYDADDDNNDDEDDYDTNIKTTTTRAPAATPTPIGRQNDVVKVSSSLSSLPYSDDYGDYNDPKVVVVKSVSSTVVSITTDILNNSQNSPPRNPSSPQQTSSSSSSLALSSPSSSLSTVAASGSLPTTFDDNPLNTNLISGGNFIDDDNSDDGAGDGAINDAASDSNGPGTSGFYDSSSASDQFDDKSKSVNHPIEINDKLKTLQPTFNDDKFGDYDDNREKQDNMDELMLNDGLIPVDKNSGFVEYNSVDNIDIVKLENNPSSEDEYYKTIDKNDVSEDVDIATIQKPVKQPQILKTVPPVLTLSSDQITGKRILVNLSIATDDGSGTENHSVYTLHVSVPAEEISKKAVQPLQKPAEVKVPPASFCIPEPPPRIPECPCICKGPQATDYDTDEHDDTFLDPHPESILPSTTTISPIGTLSSEASTSISMGASVPDLSACPDIGPVLILEGDLVNNPLTTLSLPILQYYP